MAANDPLLLIGPGRGGTTLLMACLAGHPDVRMRPELGGKAILLGYERPVEDPRTLLEDRLDAFRAACEAERAACPVSVWGNKITTEQISGLEFHNIWRFAPPGEEVDVVAALCRCMRDYRIVFIQRDGRVCAASKARRAGQSLAEAAYWWRYGVRVLRTLRAAGRLETLVRFEDLVQAPEATLRELSGVLGLDYHPAMLEQTASDALPAAYRNPGFVPQKTEIPELPPAILDYLRDDLAWCGYL